MKFIVNKEFKDTEIGKIPKDWELVELGNNKVSVLVKSGVTPSKKVKNYWNGNIPFVTQADMTKVQKFLFETSEKITELGLKSYNLITVPENSVLLSMYGTIGKVVINKTSVAISQNIAAIIPNKKYVNESFLYYSIIKHSYQFKKMAKTITLKHLDIKIVKNMLLTIPPLSEQEKIAEILSTVDSAIEKVDEEISKTEQLKKGLMQELLTKGIGHKEFKDTPIGRIPKDWELYNLGDNIISVSIKAGGTPLKSNRKYYENGTIPFVKIEDMVNSGKYLIKTEEKITEEGLINSNAWIVPENSILFSMYASYGEVSINRIPVATNQAILAIVPNKTKIVVDYLYYYLSSLKFNLRRYIRSTTQANLNAQIVKSLSVKVPPLSEQEKIAEILSTIDNKLSILLKKKEYLEQLKNGLMNLLLTGKIRVIE